MAQATRRLLPLQGQPAERADAARNRRTLLVVANVIREREGCGAMTMDRVAVEAGVGVGTVYRRFGDRAGLANALLDESEKQFQEAFLTGPPPLGPGAPPVERLHAYVHAYVDRLEDDDLMLLAQSQSPVTYYRAGAHQAGVAHVRALLGQADYEGDIAYVTDALFALLGAGLYRYQREERGFDPDRIKAGVDHFLDRLLA
jgi:AcrR family transcriptional regulator